MTRLQNAADFYSRPEGVPEGSVVSAFRVPPEAAGARLDLFVQSQLRRTSRTRTQQIIKLSAYDETGRRLWPNDRVRAHQTILLWRPPWDEAEVPVDLPILYEDDHLLAIDKPPMLPVHPTARYYKNTLIKLLQSARPKEFVTLAHRLDRETSGIILVAKTRECDRAVKRLFEERDEVDKSYLAITWGVPSPDAPAGATPQAVPGAFRCELPLELDLENRYKVKMRIGRTDDAQSAATGFEVLGVRERARRTYALVRCDLETGRQHQIRVHLQSYGTPIVGDKLYGPDESYFALAADGELTDEHRVQLELPRHALHAARIALPHPITGADLAIESPLPADLAEFWESLARA
ncbi:RluA family pseudouridine synthase [Pendulispora rubella]|uniref:Pseudouridine synthase n=1 Tax=Pendulispora rubella TaxID=2741070 RepID=A0ABZ2LG41_9BACT